MPVRRTGFLLVFVILPLNHYLIQYIYASKSASYHYRMEKGTALNTHCMATVKFVDNSFLGDSGNHTADVSLSQL